MTNEEWAALELKLSHSWGSAKLRVDGFDLAAQVKQDKMRLVIAVYVNGVMKGVWLTQKTEEATRFCRPCTFALWSPSAKKKLTAGLSKSSIKKYFPDLDKKGTYYLPYWLSFSAFRRHLQKFNKSIEMMVDEDMPTTTEATSS
jgi:hypothetical protein